VGNSCDSPGSQCQFVAVPLLSPRPSQTRALGRVVREEVVAILRWYVAGKASL